MAKSLDDLLAEVMVSFSKEEFCFYHLGSGKWLVMLGNPSPHVYLGEVDGKYEGEEATLAEAVKSALAEFKAANG